MLGDLITSKVRVKILNSLLEDPENMYHVREIVRRVSEEINAVRRELILLEKKGILKKEPRSNRVYYFLDKTYPYYQDLLTIFAKSTGVGRDIIENKAKLGRIKYAMMSGKFIKGKKENPESVDLLIVGTVVLPELALIVKTEENRRKKEINYTVMTEEEFVFRKRRQDPFIFSVISGSRVMLIGDEESLTA